MNKLILLLSGFLLIGCASPTKELYESTNKTCPKTCSPDKWMGYVQALKLTDDFYGLACICGKKQ